MENPAFSALRVGQGTLPGHDEVSDAGVLPLRVRKAIHTGLEGLFV